MEKRKSSVPKPKAWLYFLIFWLCRLLAKVLFRLKITGQKSLPKEGPLLVLCTHQGMMDVFMVVAALKGRVAQFVATQRQFRHPKLNWLYTRMGVIPKVQFHTDPRCVMNIMRVLKKDGIFIQVLAAQDHLMGLKSIIYPEILLKEKDSVPNLEGFELVSSTPVRFEFTAEGEQIGNLLSMTPHFWRISAEGAKRLKNTEILTDTASCVLNVYRKQS